MSSPVQLTGSGKQIRLPFCKLCHSVIYYSSSDIAEECSTYELCRFSVTDLALLECPEMRFTHLFLAIGTESLYLEAKNMVDWNNTTCPELASNFYDENFSCSEDYSFSGGRYAEAFTTASENLNINSCGRIFDFGCV